jgi:Fic family protein
MGSSTILPFMDRFQSRFTFSLTEEVLIHLLHLDQDSAGAVRSSEVMDSNQRDEYIVLSLIEEAITSSQLEGASTTRKVAEKMLREARPPRTDGERMILNNYKTMRAIQMFRGEPFTQRRVLELHRLVTEGTLKDPADAGRLRNSDDVFVFDRDNGERLHIPPPHQELPDRLELLCDFANRAESDLPFVHPVLRAILLHFMLGYDHPFVDGNGRTARALFYWSMLRSGYWMTEFISISHFLRKAPVQYGMAYLYAETDEGDTTYFLIHQLQTIRKAVDALHDFLARRTAEQRSLERLIAPASSLGQSLNHRQRAILAHAIRKPGAEYRIAGHKSLHAVTYQTARTDLVGLANLGLLDLHLVGKAFVFTAPPDLKRRIGKLEAGPHAS